MSIKTAQELHRIYHYRHINYIDIKEVLTVIQSNDKTYAQVYDTNLTKNLLESKKLSAFNYYEAGMERLKNKSNEDLSELENFWNTSLLFINGQPHKELKLRLKNQITLLENYLLENKADILNHLHKYITISNCPIQLSIDITNIISSYLISNVSGVSFKESLEFILIREPVFYNYFHTKKQFTMGRNLNQFFKKNDLNGLDPIKKILLETIIFMGIDPIVGMICTNQLTGVSSYFDAPIVSYITRISTNRIEVLGHDFKPGTIFNLSLVPNIIQYEAQNYEGINFGFSTHKCLGIQLTKIIVDLALDFLKENPAKKINENEFQVTSDGTFLKFVRA